MRIKHATLIVVDTIILLIMAKVGTLHVRVIFAGNGAGDQSVISGRSCLHFLIERVPFRKI